MTKRAPLKLLIVDDHAALRRTVRLLFDEREVTFLEASSGEEAVKLFGTERPDWVVMDMCMPGIGGLKATEALRRIDPTARVMVISQFTDAEYAEQARHVGAVDFVSKEDLSLLPQIIQSDRASMRAPLQH